MVLSESLTNKVGMCGGTIQPLGLTGCPWASAHVSLEALPTFVGGSCDKCVPGCVGDVANDCVVMKAGGAAIQAPPPEEAAADLAQAENKATEGGGGGWLSGWW